MAHAVQTDPLSKYEEVVVTTDVECTKETVGDTLTFLCALIFSFVFSWVGFLICICLSTTIAGRYGALAGWGFSMMLMGWINHQFALPFLSVGAIFIICGLGVFYGAYSYSLKHP